MTPCRRKILSVLGTRPEVIKLAPVIKRLAADPDRFESRVCATGQHREMLDQALRPFGITPDYDLNLMTAGQRLAGLTARAIRKLDGVIGSFRPDVVLVQGDTTTAFCGALAAFYRRVAVGHVEAGLRTGNKYAPFPEEINRRLISQVSDYHFAPTERARAALVGSGVAADTVFVTGNTVVDALLDMRRVVEDRAPTLAAQLAPHIDGRDLVMVTGHRRESFGRPFEQICLAIREVADAFSDAVFVYPVHLNPRVREPVWRILGTHPRVRLLEPLAYDDFVWLMSRAAIVLTDSGGVQEEAPVLGKPVLVMRTVTERQEGVDSGNARLVGLEREAIVEALTELLSSRDARQAMGSVNSPYGDGLASERIVEILREASLGRPALSW